MNKLIVIIILLSVTLLTFCGCDRHSAAWSQMDAAERLMDSMPDSALSILSRLDDRKFGGNEEKARHALLKSIALDKNYIDTTTFDVLQPAIDYYLAKGTPDEKLRTYYYQGRIYQNKGDLDSAMSTFINGRDLQPEVKDTLILAHTMVAQGSLYYRQYKIKEYTLNNIEAAKLYGAINHYFYEISSLNKALGGYVMLSDKVAADSIVTLCEQLLPNCREAEPVLFPSLLLYTIEFRTPYEIKIFLNKYQNRELTNNEILDFAQGYSKIGEYDKALNYISSISPGESILDSLKYAAVSIGILEKHGLYQQALVQYEDYSRNLGHYHDYLFTNELLFSDKKHQFEIDSLKDKRRTERILWCTGSGIFLLIMLACWFYYMAHVSKTKRILAETENENLRLEQDILRKKKEIAELETINLKLEIANLETERDKLKKLQHEQTGLAKPVREAIKERLDMVNGLLAKEITSNERYAKTYNQLAEMIHNDKKKFMDSTRIAFKASSPKFINYLERHGLTTDEINYICLYAIGLRGKEVGEYIQLKSHYQISSGIRNKLGIDEHETNLGLYIRRLMEELEK